MGENSVLLRSTLSAHLKTLHREEFLTVREEIASLLAPHGIEIIFIEDPLDEAKLETFKDPDNSDSEYFAKHDFKLLADQYNISHLIVLEVKRIGVARPYYGFIPTGDPRALFEVRGRAIDLSTNQLVWHANFDNSQFSTGGWDEPPSFPGLTTSFYACMESARAEILASLERKAETAEPKVEGAEQDEQEETATELE